ncbi:AAWKG family protein, partial [Streptomyces zhihengii]|uniref:AAWKG family protein n=1 Tax=Streptomyces zhihengii TaxID=1818004 RepID=UPI0033B7842A
MPADNWENLIKLMTGWTLPTRAEVTSQQGDSGIKWMNVQIERYDDPLQVQAQGNVLQPGGAVFNFYEPQSSTYRGLRELGGVRVTVTYTNIELGREFWRRGSGALDLLLSNFSTVGAQGDGAPAGSEGVDLRTLPAAAKSFDSAGKYFAERTALLKQWEEAMGSENAAWKGTAAEVFRMLLNRLHEKYENYLSQLRPPGFSPTGTSPSTSYVANTLHGDGLVKAEQDLYNGYQKLFDAHYSYYWRQAKELSYQRADGTQASGHFPADPRETLGDLMADIAQWIEAYNYNQVSREGVRVTENVTRGSGAGNVYFALGPSFSTSPRWGDLMSTSTWSVIAEEATSRWTRNVEENLDAPARLVATEVSEAWNRTLDPGWNTRFAFQDNGSSSLTEELRAAQAEEDAENARKQQEEFTNQIKGIGDNLGGIGDNLEKNLGGIGDNLEENLGGIGDKFGSGIDNLTSGFKDVLGGGNDPLSRVSLPEGGTQQLGGGPEGPLGMPEMPELGAGSGTGTDSVTLPDGQTAQVPTNLLGNPAGLSLPGGSDGTGSSGSSVQLPDGQTMFSPEAPGTGTGLGLPGIPTLGGPLGTPRGETGTREEFPNGLVQTTLPDGTTSFTTPDGTTTTVGEDGAVTSEFADGTRTSVSPDGSWTSVLPDGTTVGDRLEPGEELTHPDGSTTGLGPDGALTTTLPDGSSYTVGPDGTSTVELPDGTTRETFPNGLVQTTLPDGTTSFTTPDGTTTTVGEDG